MCVLCCCPDLQQKAYICSRIANNKQIMFKRKISEKLECWKRDKNHKPLILRGARQVGKTTVVNEFGRQFDNYLYFI